MLINRQIISWPYIPRLRAFLSKPALYPILSSVFIVVFLLLFQPFNLHRTKIEQLIIGLLVIGMGHCLLLSVYLRLVKLRQRMLTRSRQLLTLIPFFILTALLTQVIHVMLGFSAFSAHNMLQWFYASFLVMPLPHMLRLFALKKNVFLQKGPASFYGIEQKQLLFCKALENYIELVFLEKGQVKKRLIRATMQHIESELDNEFVRCHRSYILNKSRLFELQGNKRAYRAIVRSGDEHFEIPVSAKKKHLLSGQ